MSWMFAVVQEVLHIVAFSFYSCRVCSPLFRRVVVKLSSIVVGLAPHGLTGADEQDTRANRYDNANGYSSYDAVHLETKLARRRAWMVVVGSRPPSIPGTHTPSFSSIFRMPYNLLLGHRLR